MYHNVVLSIDELFDVRSTVWMELVGEDTFVKMLDDRYAVRLSDRFDQYIPYSKYLEKYNERDAATVRRSTVTTLLPVIQHLLKTAWEQYERSPIITAPMLYLHVPPRYDLTDEEISGIQYQIRKAIELDIDIVILKMPCITIKKLDELRVGSFFVYDIIQWLTDLATLSVMDEYQLSPATNVVTANVHTSDQPFDRQKLDESNHTFKSEFKLAFNIEFFPAAFFTSPILTDLHLLPARQS